MTAARSDRLAMTLQVPPAASRARLHSSDVVLPVSVVLWAVGVSRTNVTTIGPYGLPAALPIVYYAGVALLVVSAAMQLASDRISGGRMSAHAVALVVMLYGTAPLVYSEGRYSWLYKTIGVVQYVSRHGHLSRHIDIYQNWPGFFALAAWFGRVAGVGGPLGYAKWAQLVFELAALPLLYLIYDALSLTTRQRWLALFLFSASNWIAQDYFSPQALGTLLSLGIMALAMRWLYLSRSSQRSGRTPPTNAVGQARQASQTEHADQAGQADQAAPGPPRVPARFTVLICVTVVLGYLVLTFSHELSPYILLVQLGALAVAGYLRPRWLPLVLAAVAVGYLLPRFSYVNSHYGLLKSIGDFFRNAAPPAFVLGNVAGSQQFIERCAELLAGGMWVLAAVGLWLRRRSGRNVRALALLAFSPIVVLAAQAYGQEGILRVYLFSLPWTAALAALALVPGRSAEALAPAPGRSAEALAPAPGLSASRSAPDRSAERETAQPASPRPPRLSWAVLRPPLALGVAVALFFPAFFGDDSFNAMPQPEVATVLSFLESAVPGPVYCAIDNAPLADTSKYDLFPLTRILGSYSLLRKAPVTPAIASTIAADSRKQTHGTEPAYVIVTPSMIAYNRAYGVTAPDSFTILLTALAHSPTWELIVHRAGITIYELPPTVPVH